MPEFSCEITVGGQPVQLAPQAESAAMRKANSVFCPLGPAPTRAWFVMLSKHAASLTSAATSVSWRQVGENAKTLTFRGLYPVSAARVFPGAPGDPNGLVLVELVDARALVAENSDAGKINANIRSYAHEEDYLAGTTGYTWTSLASELWAACDLLGAFPGLPYAPDGVPQNTRFWGVSAFRALCAVLDHLDCAIAHNPLAGTYSIVQLGAAQAVAAHAATLVWDREPRGFDADVAATVKVYAANHYRSYGQERDTERATNWSVDGAGSVSSNASGVAGAIGVRPLWDDLPRILDEDNTLENAAALSTRAAARAARYALRMGVSPQHRIHRGLLNDILPGGQVRAVLWRSWGDGTVTEFTAGADLVSGPDFAPLSLPAHENYLAPDLGRRSYPNYPRIVNVVQVYHSSESQGETVEANADGFHPGRVRRWVAGAMATLEDCWIRFVDDHDNADGDVDATDGDFYGPGRLCGIETSDGQTLPVYLVRKGQCTQHIAFTLTEDMASNKSDDATITAAWGCSCDVGETTTVHDPQGLFRDAIEGCKGIAILDKCAQAESSDPNEPYYRVVYCQRAAKRAKAVLSAAMCGSTPQINSGTWMVYQQGDFVADPGPGVMLMNLAGHRGMSGDYIWLERVTNSQPFQWQVVDVERHALQLLACATTVGGDPLNLVKCCVTAALEVCELPPCADEETSSSAPSSSGVDVPPNTSVYTCCDVPAVPDPGIAINASWSTCGGTGDETGTAIESSAAGGKLVAGAFGAGLYEAWFGESSPYCVTSIHFYCVEDGSAFFLRDSSGDELEPGLYAVLRMYCTGSGSGALSGGYYVVPAAVLSCDPLHWTAQFDLSAENLAWIQTSGVWGPSFNILENTSAQDCTVDIEITE